LLAAAQLVGLSPADVAAVAPVRRFLARCPIPEQTYLHRELNRFAYRAIGPRRLARLADALPTICRKAAAGYVYYHHFDS
jgi:hypothetical protein